MGVKNMFSTNAEADVGFFKVMSSDNGGLSDEQLTDLAADKIVSVSNSAPDPIKQQALLFSDQVRKVLLHYIKVARKEERATICYKIREAGHPDLANTIRRI